MSDPQLGPIFTGFTANEIRYIFRCTYNVAKDKLSSEKPCGKRGGAPLYHIRDIARLFITVPEMENADLIEKLMTMNVEDLPVKLQKAFWDGKRSKQTFEKEAGDLWPTDQVVDLAGEAFKTIRLSLLLMPDTIERESSLSEKQRESVQNIVDAILNELRENLVDTFKNRRERSSGESLAQEDDDPAAGL